MSRENFKPIAIEAPSKNPWLFRIRCWVDLQLASVAKPLHSALQGFAGTGVDIGAGQSLA